MRVCAVIPSFNHHETIEAILDGLGAVNAVGSVIVVDDGSADRTARALESIAEKRGIDLVRRPANGGKGAAVKTGLARAHELGFTHALQVDADGQHDLSAVPRMLDAARDKPEALVLGEPQFDETAPRARLFARRICQFWVDLETSGHVIGDPMCGFRLYPVESALRAAARGMRMEFDPEIAVKLVWAGLPVRNVPVRVAYPAGGTSHFRLFEDNLRLSWMHSRLMTRLIFRFLFGWLR